MKRKQPTRGSPDEDVRIPRRPAASASRDYDLVVAGGGIYGVALAFEAARRGYRPLLLERDDFGGGTSWSNLRIIHGGLRYLQTLDLRRFRESVAERRWFLRYFPDLVRPLPCLMPLYGHGLKRPSLLRLVLAANDVLSLDRNRNVETRARLARGRVLGVSDTVRHFPQVKRQALEGGALWWDAVMLSSERVLIELLSWACSAGATALNYVEVERVVVEDGQVTGVEARDHIAGRMHRFVASRVVNAMGPRSQIFADQLDSATPALFRPTLAFNVLIDRPPLAQTAVAVEPRPGGSTYFVLPWKGRVLAGTFHAGLSQSVLEPRVADHHVTQFLDDLNAAIPGLDLTPQDVIHVYAGLLPGRRPGTAELATRAVIHDHGAHGGPRGLYSVSGVKFTVARRVAEDTLRAMFGQLRPASDGAERPSPLLDLSAQTLLSVDTPCDGGLIEDEALIQRIVREEAVVNAEDVLLRRLDSSVALADWDRAAGTLGRHWHPPAR